MAATDGELRALALVTALHDAVDVDGATILELQREVEQDPAAVLALAHMVLLLLPTGEALRRQRLQVLAAAFVGQR